MCVLWCACLWCTTRYYNSPHAGQRSLLQIWGLNPVQNHRHPESPSAAAASAAPTLLLTSEPDIFKVKCYRCYTENTIDCKIVSTKSRPSHLSFQRKHWQPKTQIYNLAISGAIAQLCRGRSRSHGKHVVVICRVHQSTAGLRVQ